MRVKLKPVDRENLSQILRMKVPESETQFVAPNSFSLAEAYVEPELTPRALYADHTVVGFIMYGRWKGEQSLWITRLFISPDYRGRGYARGAIQLACEDLFCRPDCNRICISFVPENISARRLYGSLGFREVGKIEDEIRFELSR